MTKFWKETEEMRRRRRGAWNCIGEQFRTNDASQERNFGTIRL